MSQSIRYVGLDVHAKTIACAVADSSGDVLDIGVIPHQEDAVRRLVKRLGRKEDLRVCYEAGPTGYGLYWLLAQMGVACDVVAPSLIPRRPGDKIKTDRRDARKLARLHRAGELVAIWVPDAAHEALRDLVRLREAATQDRTRARNRLTKFLLRRSLRPDKATRRWTRAYRTWLSSLRFDEPASEAVYADLMQEVAHASERLVRLEKSILDIVAAMEGITPEVIRCLQALRGVGSVTATTLVAELGPMGRFEHPTKLMGYSGMIPQQHSSGSRIRQGGITKTGNAHIRRVLVEAAWAISRRPGGRAPLRRMDPTISPEVREVALKAQHRLHTRYWQLVHKGKTPNKAAVAIGRELLGFVWQVARLVEQKAA